VAGNRERGPRATTIRSCRISVKTADDVIHTVEVQASSIFDAAASGVARFRDEGWIDTLGASDSGRGAAPPGCSTTCRCRR